MKKYIVAASIITDSSININYNSLFQMTTIVTTSIYTEKNQYIYAFSNQQKLKYCLFY